MMLKQLSFKGPYEGSTTSGAKLVNLTPSYINATFWSTGKMLADRTSLVRVNLMFVLYRMKGLKYTLFYLCVCMCVCVCISCCVAMHIYFILYL